MERKEKPWHSKRLQNLFKIKIVVDFHITLESRTVLRNTANNFIAKYGQQNNVIWSPIQFIETDFNSFPSKKNLKCYFKNIIASIKRILKYLLSDIRAMSVIGREFRTQVFLFHFCRESTSKQEESLGLTEL